MVTASQFADLVSNITSLQATLSALSDTVATNQADSNSFYLLWAGAVVFLMQAGFATLSAGSIRQKNVKNILLKNLLDACCGALSWYFIGYGFAYPGTDTGNAFIGLTGSAFALGNIDDTVEGYASTTSGTAWISWYFQFAFAAAAATIVSGAVAERCALSAYLIYTLFITGFIYPVVVHWVWDSNGWLSAWNSKPVGGPILPCIDFAGSGVVHMTGGFAAMVGAKILGPRLGRFENPAAFEGHSTPLVIIGTFLLWFGWYGFNPGSTLAITGGYGRDAARACVTTTLSAAAGGVTGLFIKKFLPTGMGGTHIWDIAHTCNSLLGGLVGITAGCACVTARDSIFIGMISAFFYHGASCMMRKLKIDDPLDAFAVHGACGVWGVWAVGFFGVEAYCDSVFGIKDAGLLFTGFKGKLLLTQLVVPLIEIAWVVTMSAIMFGILKVLKIFRVSPDEETAGMDVSKHGGDAYPESKSGM